MQRRLSSTRASKIVCPLSPKVSGFISCILHCFTLLTRTLFTELLEAVKASLRAKVAALAEDSWMYEKQEEPRTV